MRDKLIHAKWLCYLLCVLPIVVCSAATGKIIYVDDDSVGAKNGTSWENAYIYLQDALADANTAEKPVEIRVAQGVYTPDKGSGFTRGDIFVAFQLINGVSVLGGFAGVGAIEPDSRYIDAYKTILSGDLAGDDADINNPSELSGHPTRAENSIAVVRSIGTNKTAKLDGVTITAGNSYNMTNSSGSPVVENCTFLNARIGIYASDGDQIVSNCMFKGLCSYAINWLNGNLTIINCMFAANTHGVIYCSGENLRLYNCIFRDNVVGGAYGITASLDREFIVENCIFVGNIGLPIDHDRGRMIVSNCLFAGNKEGFLSSGIFSLNKYVTVQNCTFSGNSSLQGGSALNLLYGGKVSNCIFWGNSRPAIDADEDDVFMRYCNIQESWSGEGNIEVDPCFILQGYWDQNGTPEDVNDDFWVDGDYHLQSQAGHWDEQSQTWVLDDVTSPCIDTGDPNSPIGTEPFPNGGRVNMGAYGGCDKASKSYFGESVSEVIIAGDINGDGIVDGNDLAILNSHWMMQEDDFINKLPIVQILEPKDGDRIARPGPTIFRAEANDPDGQVDDVEFWIKHQTDGGYTSYRLSADNETNGWEREYTWKDELPSGTWTVWAEATDDEGQVSSSPEITIMLYHP